MGKDTKMLRNGRKLGRQRRKAKRRSSSALVVVVDVITLCSMHVGMLLEVQEAKALVMRTDGRKVGPDVHYAEFIRGRRRRRGSTQQCQGWPLRRNMSLTRNHCRESRRGQKTPIISVRKPS